MLERNVCEGQWPTPNDTKVIKGCLGTVFFFPPCRTTDIQYCECIIDIITNALRKPHIPCYFTICYITQ